MSATTHRPETALVSIHGIFTIVGACSNICGAKLAVTANCGSRSNHFCMASCDHQMQFIWVAIDTGIALDLVNCMSRKTEMFEQQFCTVQRALVNIQ
jgi:hypothetical protein